MRERRHLDRTDHQRVAEDRRRRRRRGPSEKRLKEAIDAIASHDVPGTPGLGHIKAIRDACGLPYEAGDRRVVSLSITEGRPRHGAMRSDDHIGRYAVQLPLHEIAPDVLARDACPECGGTRGEYAYHAHHHIAGGESLVCADCDAELYSNDWG